MYEHIIYYEYPKSLGTTGGMLLQVQSDQCVYCAAQQDIILQLPTLGLDS